MSYPCIKLVVKEILGKGQGEKSQSSQTTSFSVAVDNHSFGESIQEGTSTSARNQNKAIYSKIFSGYAKWFRNAEHIGHILYS